MEHIIIIDYNIITLFTRRWDHTAIGILLKKGNASKWG